MMTTVGFYTACKPPLLGAITFFCLTSSAYIYGMPHS